MYGKKFSTGFATLIFLALVLSGGPALAGPAPRSAARTWSGSIRPPIGFFLAARLNPGGPVLGVIDGLTETFLQNIRTTPGDHSVAVDPVSGEVFVPFGGSFGTATNSICPLGCIGVFAVVPELGSLLLLAAGLIAVLASAASTDRGGADMKPAMSRLMLVSALLFLTTPAAVVSDLLTAAPAAATPFFFSTGNPDGKMATASRPSGAGKIEIESGDDFVLASRTSLNMATFTGLLTGATPTIGEVRVEIYRVFPADSNVARTSGPPMFSTPHVPTRVNSPSDVELTDRDTASGNLTFVTSMLASSFTASNSVLNGIHPSPGQTTGGEGAVTGQEVQFTVTFTTPFDLPADHYFFVPQVLVTGGEFFWLSAPRPIIAPGTPFPPGSPDLQEWIRNEDLAPDWLRVGTDIVGGATPPTFNATFSLTGNTIPEPASLMLFGAGLAGLALSRRMRRRDRE